MAKVEVLHYTDKELAAIEVLKAHRGVKMSAKELGIPIISEDQLIAMMR